MHPDLFEHLAESAQRQPHNIEMALAYDIKCPRCKGNNLKQVGRCKDFYTLGLYDCPVCDRD